jgi:hypothetical protein
MNPALEAALIVLAAGMGAALIVIWVMLCVSWFDRAWLYVVCSLTPPIIALWLVTWYGISSG